MMSSNNKQQDNIDHINLVELAHNKDAWATYEAISGVKVRDYGFENTDCRHYGIPLPLDGEDSDESDESSNLSQYSDIINSSELPALFDKTNEDPTPYEYRLLNADDVFKLVLPQLSKELQPHIGGVTVKFQRIRAMFDFQKVTAWEMNIKENEELFIASIDTNDEENKEDKTDKEDKKLDSNEDKNKESEIKADNSDDNGEEKDNDTKDADDKNKEKDNNDDDDDEERWATIDEDDTQSTPDVTLRIDPVAPDFAAQLNQLLDYQGVYGSGWVTGIKLRIKGRQVKPKPDLTSAILGMDNDEQIAKIRVRMYNLGLVPGNYVEKL